MNVTRPIYPHESDHRIIIKKDRAEINNWTDDLEYMNEELEYLLDIEDRMLNNTQVYQQLTELRRQNQLQLGELYRYEGAMGKAIECDTIACDSYYLHKHEKTRNQFRDHIQKYRNVKKKLFSIILMNARR